MKNIGDLINQAAASLKNKDIKGRDFSRPHYPACVLYFGKRSARHHAKLSDGLMDGWGGGASRIAYYVVDDATELRFAEAASARDVPVDEVLGSIAGLLSAHEVFDDMSRVAVYCLIDTAGVGSAEEFEQWYMAIEKIKKLTGAALFSMLIVILDDGIKCAGKALLIKNKLHDIYKSKEPGPENSHLYDSVFVIGSRYRNGGMACSGAGSEPCTGYDMLAGVILLANSRESDYNKRRMHLYGSNKPALTAAYGCVEKPVREIALITIRALLKRVLESIERHPADADSLALALTIKNGRSGIYDKIYSSIKPRLPREAEFITLLPGKVAAGFSYEDADRASDGCLSAFLDMNHLKIIEEELESSREDLESSIAGLLSKNLNAAQLHDGLPLKAVETALARAETGLAGDESCNVCLVIEVKAKKRIAEMMREATKKAIGAAAEGAKACYDAFKLINHEIDMQNTILEEGTKRNLLSTYEPKVQRAFSDRAKLDSLANRMLAIGNDKSMILDILLEATEELFAGDEDYRLSYFDELTKRLGHLSDTMKAQEYVGDELIKNLGDRVSFYTNSILQERIFEAYLLNTGAAAGASENLLVRHLEDRPKPPEAQRTFFNTCSNDRAESIWFYALSEDNLKT